MFNITYVEKSLNSALIVADLVFLLKKNFNLAEVFFEGAAIKLPAFENQYLPLKMSNTQFLTR